jgi:hypothetical protein
MDEVADFLVLHQFPEHDLARRWRDFLAGAECPAHYDAPEFFLEPFWLNMRPFAVLALREGSIHGVLTGHHNGDEVVSGLASRPQICVRDGASSAGALDSLARGLLREAGSSHRITVYSWSPAPLEAFAKYGFRTHATQGSIVLDLSQGPEELFRQFSPSRRRNIRRAERKNVEVFQASSSEDFAAFYAVYRSWRRTERKTIEGTELPFETLENACQLVENRRLFLARFSGRIIAGSTVRFYPKGLLECSANASLDGCQEVFPNDLLLWRTIEWGCREGFRECSLGGTQPFLARSGGEVKPIYRFRADRTWMHRYDLGERLVDTAREVLHKLPPPFETRIRRALGKISARPICARIHFLH